MPTRPNIKECTGECTTCCHYLELLHDPHLLTDKMEDPPHPTDRELHSTGLPSRLSRNHKVSLVQSVVECMDIKIAQQQLRMG